MKKLIFAFTLVSLTTSVYALDFSLEKMNAANLEVKTVEVPVPSAPAKQEVTQDLINRFNRLNSDLSRLESDTTWLRSDINRLESDARRIEQGSSNAFFANDLRRMSKDMSTRSNTIQRLAREMKDLLNLAQKDANLNQIAGNIEWAARDLDNRFQFDVINAAQSLESTVRRIDAQLIGYNAQWDASDLSRNCRDIQWKTRDLRWDARDLVSKTQP